MQRVKKWLQGVPCRYYPILFTILAMLPIIISAAYTHPWWDDYTYPLPAKEAYENGAGLFGILKTAFQVTVYKYETWSGAYAHQFFAALEPQFIHYDLYKAAMVVTVLCFIFSIFLFVNMVNKHILKLERWCAYWIAAAITVLTAYFMPMPHEFFFWLAGASNYTWVMIVMLAAFSAYICFWFEQRRIRQVLQVTVVALGAFITGGSNHSSALLLCCITGLLAVISFFTKTSKKNKIFAVSICLLAAASLLLNMAAPGNAVRMETEVQLSPVHAVIYAVSNTAFRIWDWTAGAPLAAVLIILPFILPGLKKSEFRFPWPAAFAAVSFLLVCTQYVPTYYAMSYEGPGRVSDCVYLTYCIWLFAVTVYTAGWFLHRYQVREIRSGTRTLYLITVLAAALFIVSPEQISQSTGLVCAKEILNGETQTYDREMKQIRDLLAASGGGDVTAPALTADPMVRAGDFGEEASDYRNEAAAGFFGAGSLRVIDE